MQTPGFTQEVGFGSYAESVGLKPGKGLDDLWCDASRTRLTNIKIVVVQFGTPLVVHLTLIHTGLQPGENRPPQYLTVSTVSLGRKR